MSAKGYTDRDRVAAELGRTLTPDQAVQCDDLIEEVEGYLDNELNRAWLTPSPVAAEQHVVTGRLVYLDSAPVLSVTSVELRSAAIGSPWITLSPALGYELLDAEAGVLAVGGYSVFDVVSGGPYSAADPTLGGLWALGALVRVTYATAGPPVPADLRRAATLLAAAWLLPRLEAGAGVYDTVSVGQGDLSVKYRDLRSAGGVPPAVDTILANYRRVIFA